MGLRRKLKVWSEKVQKELAKTKSEALSPARFKHPLAEKTDWFPLKKGGSNFGTHYLDTSQRDRLVFKLSKGGLAFISVFAVVGVLGLIIPVVFFFYEENKEWTFLLLALLFGGVFSAASLFMYKMMAKPRVFDTFYKEYYSGKTKPHDLIKDEKNPLISFRDIVALQIIKEYVKSDKSSYYSYELNLVLKDASRVNVVDHGKINQMREDAKKLSMHIGVPLWDAS